jgi:hypothetical protein
VLSLPWAAPEAEAQQTKIAPERQLFGSWHGAGGDWTLVLGTDKSAVMEVGLTTNQGKSIDWRRGTFSLYRGAWTLHVRDVDRRESVYAIVPLSADELNLIDVGGKYTRFFRTRETNFKRITGRWLGPGSDSNLNISDDRVAVLEVGVGQQFGPFSEIRAGTVSVHNGFWTMTVRKVEVGKTEPAPENTYAIISHAPYEMSLVDSKGNVLKFHRLGEPFEALAPGLGHI